MFGPRKQQSSSRKSRYVLVRIPFIRLACKECLYLNLENGRARLRCLPRNYHRNEILIPRGKLEVVPTSRCNWYFCSLDVHYFWARFGCYTGMVGHTHHLLFFVSFYFFLCSHDASSSCRAPLPLPLSYSPFMHPADTEACTLLSISCSLTSKYKSRARGPLMF